MWLLPRPEGSIFTVSGDPDHRLAAQVAGRYEVEVWRGRELLTTVEATLTEGAETPLQIVLKE